MDPLFVEMLKQSPTAAALIIVTWMFLKAATEQSQRHIEAERQAEATRVENAKALESERQKHEREMNNMWANYLKNLTVSVNDGLKALMSEMNANEDRALDRYNRLNYTGKSIEKSMKESAEK
jgi:hypothetical protein